MIWWYVGFYLFGWLIPVVEGDEIAAWEWLGWGVLWTLVCAFAAVMTWVVA